MLKSFLNLFLQSHCPLCQRSTSAAVCEYCARQLKNCGQKNPCASWHGEIPVFGWGIYGGTIRRAIALMKYENQPELGRVLGEWLGEAWLLNSPHRHTQLVVVPIPLNPQKLKQRGYNQAAIIAQSFCQITKLELNLNGLSRIRETKAQFGLSMSEREKNLAQAFTVGKEFRTHRPQVPVLLIDDIYTTGATAKSAVQTFRQSEITVLGLAAVAIAIKDQQTNS